MQPEYQFPHSSPAPPAGPEDSDAGVKQTKAQANYRPAGSSETRCGTCAHYQGDGICGVVAGLVDEGGVSDLWEPRSGGLVDLIGGLA